MATGWQTFPVEFKGGLISNLSPLQQGINEVGSAVILDNFEPTREGGYKKVLGYEKYSETLVPGIGSILGVRVVSDTKVLVARADPVFGRTRYFRGSGTSWTWVAPETAGVGGKVRSTSYNFGLGIKVAVVDGVNAPGIFTDSSNTLTFLTGLTDAIGATHVVVYKQTLFFANGTNLIFGAPYSDTDFTPATGAGIINTTREITGLVVFRDQLIIFSRNQIQRLVGSTAADFQLIPITENIGCIAPDTIQEFGGDILFMGPDGLRLLSSTERTGDFALEIASNKISKTAADFMSPGSSFVSAVIRSKAQYRLFRVSSVDTADSAKGLLATKFSDQGASRIDWSTLTGFRVEVIDSRYSPIGASEELILFGNNTGYIYKMDSGNSRDGSSIHCIYQSPFMPITDPQKRKTLYKMSLYIDTVGFFEASVNFLFDLFKVDNYNGAVKSPTVTLSNTAGGTIFFYGFPTSLYGEALYGEAVDNVYETPMIGSGKTFSLRLEEDSTDSPFTLDTAVFEYKENDRQ